jgi:hypothetical protein
MSTCIELRQVHRQSDPEFINVLARIRMGRCTPEDVRVLRSTERNAVDGVDGVEATRLCTHVSDADAINTTRIKALSGATRAFPARDAYGGDSALLRALNATCRAPQTLELKEGAQVIAIPPPTHTHTHTHTGHSIAHPFPSHVVVGCAHVPDGHAHAHRTHKHTDTHAHTAHTNTRTRMPSHHR